MYLYSCLGCLYERYRQEQMLIEYGVNAVGNLLEVEAVSKDYGVKRVVNEVSFEVKPGEIMAMLGPNGAGKTTTIRMIMGITAPDQGRITFYLNGEGTNAVPKNRVGYLPEERGLYKEARVMDILLFLAGLKDITKETAKETAMVWLEKFGLENNAHSKIEQLSKGMAQKVQFIASIIHKPGLIVLDEPFSGLDPVSQDLFKEEIRALAEQGAAILLSSHQMNLVEETCDRIFLIHEGKKVLYGSLQDIKDEYGNYKVNIYSRSGIGSLAASPMISDYKRNGPRWILGLKGHIKPAQFLSSIPEDTPIDEISVSRISLHDIFVKVAKGGIDHETNYEDNDLGGHEKFA